MKKLTTFLLLLLFACSAQMQSQNGCSTMSIGETAENRTSDFLHFNTTPFLNNTRYCINVQVHRISRSNGTGGISTSVLNNQVSKLNSQFGGTGIKFIEIGAINEVNDDALYNNSFWTNSPGSCTSGDFSSLDQYAKPTQIDLFFHPLPLNDLSGARGIANRTQIMFSGLHPSTNILAHEMGHVLGLFHPWHGNGAANICENQDSCNEIKECGPPMSNGASAGDFVEDTVAELIDEVVINQNTCQVTSIGRAQDDCDQPYSAPDVFNFMRKGKCGNSFTPLQVRRMKYYISHPNVSNIELQMAIETCPPLEDDPDPCEICQGAQQLAKKVADSLIEDLNECNVFSVSYPTFGSPCNYTAVIDWGDGTKSELSNLGETASHPYPTNTFDYTIKVTIKRGDEICSGIEESNIASVNCDPNDNDDGDCPNCNESGIDILNSITPNTGCESYNITVPIAVTACYDTVKIDLNDGNGFQTLSSGTTTLSYTGSAIFEPRLIIGHQSPIPCFDDKKAVPCISEIPCGWPKSYGSDNPHVSNPKQEYISNVVEDSSGNIYVLGRSNANTMIENIYLEDTTFIAKYDTYGCLIKAVPLPTLNYPKEMFIDSNNRLTIVSQDMNFNGDCCNPEVFRITKINSNGELLTTTNILVESYFQNSESFSFNESNGDVYFTVGNDFGFLSNTILEVEESNGNTTSLDHNSILRINALGRLNWFEEVSEITFNDYIIIGDLEFDQGNDKLIVNALSRNNSTIKLETSNQTFQLGQSSIGDSNIEFQLIYTLDSSNDPVFIDHYNYGTIPASPLNKIAANGSFIYVLTPFSDQIHVIASATQNYIGSFDAEGFSEIKYQKRTNRITAFGAKNDNVNFIIIKDLEVVSGYNRNYTFSSFPLDITITSDRKIFTAGYFNGSHSDYPDHIGGFDGFALRFIENNGTISQGLTENERFNLEIMIYPNPFTDQFKIDLTSDHQIGRVEIFNSHGMLMQSQSYKKGQTLHFSKGASGLYFVKVYLTNGEVQIINLIKK